MPAADNSIGNWNISDLWAPWLRPAQGAFVQPILPGWALMNINTYNSTAPQTEADVVAKHSYGRQIGRISDALRALLLERRGTLPEDGPFGEFISMWNEIDQVKTRSAVARLEQIAADLELLKVRDKDEYARLRNDLSSALKRTG